MTFSPRRMLLSAAAPLAGLVFALLLSSVVLIISGSNPIDAFGDMLENGSRLETMIDTLNGATPLYISGIAAAIGFRMNLFNIGVEGQYLLASFFAAYVGGQLNLPPVLHVTAILLVAVAVGAAYSGFAGVLKVTSGVNEVISTIMLNAIAVSGIIAGLIVIWQDDSGSTNSGTRPIDESGRLPNLNGVVELFTREIGKGRNLTGVLLIAVLVGVLYHLLINRSRLGFDIRASGENPFAARAGGVPPKRMIVLAMTLSGATAGLVGMAEILSRKFKYDQSFIQGLGFKGIAVALLGRNHPLGIAFGAILIAFLEASSGILQITGSASKEIVDIMVGVILLAAVVAYEVVGRIRDRDEAEAAAKAMESEPGPPVIGEPA